MKKIIAFLLVFTLSFGAVTNISALNNSAVYSYSYKDYETTILNSTNEYNICFEIVENGEKIKLKSGEYKSRKIDTVDWNKKENLEKWREQWANYANRTLEKNGIKERIDHRTLAEQGIERVPQIHVGTHASAKEKKGGTIWKRSTKQ